MNSSSKPTPERDFPQTDWVLISAASSGEEATRNPALAQVCEAYWRPLYAYARKCGYGPEDAKDLTQSFCLTMIERQLLVRAHTGEGRFRSFLLASFKLHMAKERERATARKRSTGQSDISIQAGHLEARLAKQLATTDSPDVLYERTWTLAMLEEAMHLLEKEYKSRGRLDVLEKVRSYLTGESQDAARHAELAKLLGMTEGSVGVLITRMRHRYMELLRELVRRTVNTADEVEDELQHFAEVLRGL